MNPPRDTRAPTRTLMLIILAGFAAMLAAYLPSPASLLAGQSARAPQVVEPPPLKMAAMPPREAFAEIASRPIFNNARRPDPPTTDATVQDVYGEGTVSDLSQFRVVGIVTDRETQLALVQTPAGKTERVRAGDTLEGWRIEKIDVSGVTATDGIRSARLAIPRAQNKAPTP